MAVKKVLKTEECKGQTINLANYTHIRAYHACRAESIQTYKDNGLQAFNKETALDEAIRKLIGGRVTEVMVKEQFDTMWKDSDTNQLLKVWLMLEKSELLGNACHYLIYGSEFLNALAMHLGCRDKLKDIDRPTIIACDVPLKDISEIWLRDLEKDIEDGSASMRSISVYSVAPQNLVWHIFPTAEVRDPYTWKKYKLSL